MTEEVRIVSGNAAQAESDCDFVRVCTSSDPEDDTVTLATIQRFVARRVPRRNSLWRIKTLIAEQPMSWDAAVGLATCYAKRKHIPVVYAEDAHDEEDAG